MTRGDFIALGGLFLSALAIIVIPLVVLLIRISVRWARVENRLEELTEDVKSLVIDKDRVHQEIASNMEKRTDTLDRRLRWLEEHLWKGESRAVRSQERRG